MNEELIVPPVELAVPLEPVLLLPLLLEPEELLPVDTLPPLLLPEPVETLPPVLLPEPVETLPPVLLPEPVETLPPLLLPEPVETLPPLLLPELGSGFTMITGGGVTMITGGGLLWTTGPGVDVFAGVGVGEGVDFLLPPQENETVAMDASPTIWIIDTFFILKTLLFIDPKLKFTRRYPSISDQSTQPRVTWNPLSKIDAAEHVRIGVVQIIETND